jgi:hypothetical protein
LPRQFIVMNEKRRCSILFHLLVPGGKWQTVIGNPSLSASVCNSTFHRRTRYPLLPPPSAVIISRSAAGWRFRPIVRHHRRIALTAKLAVSWSVPTLTHPTLLVMS